MQADQAICPDCETKNMYVGTVEQAEFIEKLVSASDLAGDGVASELALLHADMSIRYRNFQRRQRLLAYAHVMRKQGLKHGFQLNGSIYNGKERIALVHKDDPDMWVDLCIEGEDWLPEDEIRLHTDEHQEEE
jgi:hypothetical protein